MLNAEIHRRALKPKSLKQIKRFFGAFKLGTYAYKHRIMGFALFLHIVAKQLHHFVVPPVHNRPARNREMRPFRRCTISQAM